MIKVLKATALLVVLAGLAFAVGLAVIYFRYTPKYVSDLHTVGAKEKLRADLAGFILGEKLADSSLKSCAISKPPCLWERDEFERVVLKKKPSVYSGNNFETLPGWDPAMSNYFRPRPAQGIHPKVVPKANDIGPQHWNVLFDSDKPLGWRGLDVTVSTCAGVVTGLMLRVPLVAQGNDSVAPLLEKNPFFDLALEWFGRPDTTKLWRTTLNDWAQPMNTQKLFKPYGFESVWYGQGHTVTYGWSRGNRPSLMVQERHTIHSITMSSRVGPCPIPSEVAEQEHMRVQDAQALEALRRYKERDDKAVENDSRLFQ